MSLIRWNSPKVIEFDILAYRKHNLNFEKLSRRLKLLFIVQRHRLVQPAPILQDERLVALGSLQADPFACRIWRVHLRSAREVVDSARL